MRAKNSKFETCPRAQRRIRNLSSSATKDLKFRRRRQDSFLFFVLSLLFFWACALTSCQQGEIPPGAGASAQQRKAALLKQLDQKFENPDVHFQLGQLYQAQGQALGLSPSEAWAKAEYHYNVALGFDPAHRASQAAMVKGLKDTGNTAKAQQYANNYMNQVSASATASLSLAQQFERQDLDEYALACYQQALRIAPDSPVVNKQVGYYYLNKGDNTRAKEYLSRSFQLNPNQPDVAGELGRLGVVIKIPQAAGQTAQKPKK